MKCVGSGVLLADGEEFRLRSPNLVPLLGTQDEIFDKLNEFYERPAPTRVFRPDSYRPPFELAADQFSPLNALQVRTNFYQPSFGVVLVFGSNALRLNEVYEAAKRFIPLDLPPETVDTKR